MAPSPSSVAKAMKKGTGTFKGKNTKRGSSKSLATFIKKVVETKKEHKEIGLLSAYNVAPLNAVQTNLYPINLIGEGADYNQRIGRSVNHAYVEVDVTIINSSQTATASPDSTKPLGDAGFWALILDRNPEGVNPVFGDIFDNVSAAGALGSAFRGSDYNQDRFKVLAREEWAVGSSGHYDSGNSTVTFDTGAPPYHIKRYVDLRKLKGLDSVMKFNTINGNIAAISSGAIYFVIASSFSSAGNITQWVANTKYRYTDA